MATLQSRLSSLITAIGTDYKAIQAALLQKAPIASPAFTGNPTAVTQTPSNNSTRLATTAYADAAVAAGGGGGGSVFPNNILDKNAAFTASSGDYIRGDCTTAAFSVTLPVAPTVGTLIYVIKVDISANVLTVLPNTGQTINGDISMTHESQWTGGLYKYVKTNQWEVVSIAAPGAPAVMPTEVMMFALSDEATTITTGTAKLTMRMPYPFVLTAVRASLTVASSSGIPTVNIKESGTTILSTKLTIDAAELSSTTAAIPAVISDTTLADDSEITFDIDVAGTGAKGLKVYFIGRRT